MMDGKYELYGNPDEQRGQSMERILVLDTATRQGRVALASAGVVLVEARLEATTRRAGDLTVVVRQLLQEAQWRAMDITSVVVGLGPGSFTGLRVGLASAKALAYAVGCAFIGVETFAGIAARSDVPEGPVVVIADALQGQVFARTYHKSTTGLEPSTPLRVLPLFELLKTIPNHAYVTGPGVSLIGSGSDQWTLAGMAIGEPTPESMLKATAYPWAITTDVWRAEPLYVRGSSAEEKRRQDALNASSGQGP